MIVMSECVVDFLFDGDFEDLHSGSRLFREDMYGREFVIGAIPGSGVKQCLIKLLSATKWKKEKCEKYNQTSYGAFDYVWKAKVKKDLIESFMPVKQLKTASDAVSVSTSFCSEGGNDIVEEFKPFDVFVFYDTVEIKMSETLYNYLMDKGGPELVEDEEYFLNLLDKPVEEIYELHKVPKILCSKKPVEADDLHGERIAIDVFDATVIGEIYDVKICVVGELVSEESYLIWMEEILDDECFSLESASSISGLSELINSSVFLVSNDKYCDITPIKEFVLKREDCCAVVEVKGNEVWKKLERLCDRAYEAGINIHE